MVQNLLLSLLVDLTSSDIPYRNQAAIAGQKSTQTKPMSYQLYTIRQRLCLLINPAFFLRNRPIINAPPPASYPRCKPRRHTSASMNPQPLKSIDETKYTYNQSSSH